VFMNVLTADPARKFQISFLAMPFPSPTVAPMRPLRALVIYIIVVFVGGSLLAPWLYWLAQSAAQNFPSLANAPFHRFVNRSFLILALAGLWPLLRALGVKTLGNVGLVKPTGHWRNAVCGLGLGFLSLAVVAGIALIAGARKWPDNFSLLKFSEKISGAALTACLVAVLEEILFRGGIFGGLRRAFDWRSALVVSSAIYALVHFFAPAQHEGAVVWTSGLALLPQMLAGFANLHALIPGFFNLTLAGAALALAFQRTGNLYFAIGLHAGWIFWLMIYKALTVEVANANVWLFGSNKLIDGWLACAVLAATLFVLPRSKIESAKPSS